MNSREHAHPTTNDPSGIQAGRTGTRSQGSKKSPGALRRFLRTPKGTVLLLLIALMLVAAIHRTDMPGMLNIVAAAAAASVIDLVVGLLRRNKRIFPDGGIVTGLIIGLVLSGAVSWHVAAITSAIAVLSKHLLKVGRKPIFNPAAFALLFALLVFHTGQSWWGDLADMPVVLLPILIIAGYFMTSRVNKFPQVITYLGSYFLLLTLATSLHIGNVAFTPGDALRVPLVNSTLFMAFFMLTDPPTSPGKYSEQVTFGVVAAVVSVAIYLVFGGLTYLLIGLLVANAWKAFTNRKSSSSVRTQPAKQDELYA